MSEYDTVFSLPAVDEDPDTELGVLLMGLGPERLLAALGVASGDGTGNGTDDPATTMLLVDQLRHHARPDRSFAAAVALGGERWLAARPHLAAVPAATTTRSAALRKLWSAAVDTVAEAGVAAGHAERVYLAACWVRKDEIDRLAPTH